MHHNSKVFFYVTDVVADMELNMKSNYNSDHH